MKTLSFDTTGLSRVESQFLPKLRPAIKAETEAPHGSSRWYPKLHHGESQSQLLMQLSPMRTRI